MITQRWWCSCADSFWSGSKSDQRDDDDDDADDVHDEDDNDDDDVDDASCSCPDSF